MTAAVIIRRKSGALIRAHNRAMRAGRDAVAASKRAKWCLACEPGPGAIRQALGRALTAQNRAIFEAACADAVRSELADAWGAR